MALKTMSIAKLQDLKGKVDAAIAERISARRQELEAELSALDRVEGRAKVARGKAVRGGARGPVAPKYRNPADPTQTWAGRGLRPRWLADLLKSGKKLDDFLIVKGRKAPAAAKPKE